VATSGVRSSRDDHDREGFLERLGRCSERFSLGIYAYVLMGNHFHLLVRTREANLSLAIQWLGVSYSTWHNVGHHRSGHLFQGRFKGAVRGSHRVGPSVRFPGPVAPDLLDLRATTGRTNTNS